MAVELAVPIAVAGRGEKLTESVNVRLSPSALEKLDRVASRTGLSRPAVMRGLVQRYLETCA